jgi:hypothetical protein
MQRSQAFRGKLNELRVAGEDQWKDPVKETEKIRDALVHSFNYFKSQL